MANMVRLSITNAGRQGVLYSHENHANYDGHGKQKTIP